MELSSEKCGRYVVAAFFALFGGLAFGEAVFVDVRAWADVGKGETSGWEVSGISRTADGLTRLKEAADFALSPEYDFNVTQVVMKVLCSSVSAVRYLTLTPLIPEMGARTHTATPSESLVEQTFSWDSSEGVRQFVLRNEGAYTASWGLASLVVYTDKIAAPTDLCSVSSNCDAFAASWTPDAKAVAHELELHRVTVVLPRYDEIAAWDFSSLTNTSGNTKDMGQLKDEFPDVLSTVTGTNLCLQGKDGGHLQIGMSEKAGALVLPLGEPVAARTCRVTAWRHPKDTGTGCQAYCLGRNGETNAAVTLTAAAEPATDVFPIPDETVALRVESSKSRRIEVEFVVVAANYIEGSVTTNFVNRWRTRRSERTVRLLSPGEWTWRVRSTGADGIVSAWSPFAGVVLVADDPPLSPPGMRVLFR